ncbi:hypothetical protein BD560DRAFT_402771 [Blakeslea trispora]|nr:hypothetical protein BD560DRAFT_402771 [Blakeslea trispora]
MIMPFILPLVYHTICSCLSISVIAIYHDSICTYIHTHIYKAQFFCFSSSCLLINQTQKKLCNIVFLFGLFLSMVYLL